MLANVCTVLSPGGTISSIVPLAEEFHHFLSHGHTLGHVCISPISIYVYIYLYFRTGGLQAHYFSSPEQSFSVLVPKSKKKKSKARGGFFCSRRESLNVRSLCPFQSIVPVSLATARQGTPLVTVSISAHACFMKAEDSPHLRQKGALEPFTRP